MIKFGGTKGAVKGKRPTQRSGKRISKAEALAEAKAEALPRINTEFHGNKQKQNKPRKQNTAIRAGCVSDGINILFGKGPFDRLRDWGSFGTVSELAELADISCARVKDTA